MVAAPNHNSNASAWSPDASGRNRVGAIYLSAILSRLATVVAKNAALADAAATQAANLVATVDDVDSALEQIADIEGVDGVMIIKTDRVGLAGNLPPLVKIDGAK